MLNPLTWEEWYEKFSSILLATMKRYLMEDSFPVLEIRFPYVSVLVTKLIFLYFSDSCSEYDMCFVQL